MKDAAKNESGFDRRALLRSGVGLLSVPIVWGLRASTAGGQTSGVAPNFVLNVQAGSWDGPSAGLLLPSLSGTSGRWQTSTFAAGQNTAPNPNLNAFTVAGNLVFHNYVNFLTQISQHMCFVAGDARNPGHLQAALLQTKGDPFDQGGMPSWPGGAAQAFYDGVNPSVVVNDSYPGNTTSNLSLLGVGEKTPIDDFRMAFEDDPGIANNPYSQRFWQVLEQLHRRRRYAASNVPPSVGEAGANYVSAILKGMPQLASSAPVVADVQGNISRAKVNALIDAAKVVDGDGVKNQTSAMNGLTISTVFDEQLRQLQLAAALAKTGAAKGMSIFYPEQDSHTGGSAVATARAGCQLWAQLTTFWQWVVANQLQDRVLVIVTHQFTRSPFNATSVSNTVMTDTGKSMAVVDAGKDHNPYMGMVFINGKVPPASRVSGLADGNIAYGASALNAPPDPSLRAFTSTEIVGAMLMRVFPAQFPTEIAVRNLWTEFALNPNLAKCLGF